MAMNDNEVPKSKDDTPKNKAGKKDDKDKEPELSEEDLQLKANLDLMVERVKDIDEGVQKLALQSICSEIKSATSSMTSVPKPLKFLRHRFDELKSLFEPLKGENRKLLADILSVLATTFPQTEGVRNALYFCLQGDRDNVGAWGHEYLRHLTGELSEEFLSNIKNELPNDELMLLVKQIVPFHMTHNAEPEAVDLLLELEQLTLLIDYVDEKNYDRTCLYLSSCFNYLSEPDDAAVLNSAYDIYTKMNKFHDAMRIALRLNDREKIEKTFSSCTSLLEKKQLCYLLARQGVTLDLYEANEIEDDDVRSSLQEIISNSKLSEHFLALARDLDVMEAKVPEDVYKTHLSDVRIPTGAAVDSARQNLASTFVNSFVNAAFGQDKLITPNETAADSVHWIFKNKDHGKISATASLGMITMWDVEGGLPQVDKYLYSNDNSVIAGALLAIGLINCCVQNENDPACALIGDYVTSSDYSVQSCAFLGLGLAYAGTLREQIAEMLTPIMTEPDQPMEVVGMAALALGLVFCSSARENVVTAVLQVLMMRSEAELSGPFARFLCLSLGLLFLGKQDTVEATVEVAKTLPASISRFCEVTLNSLAYAGTGDVLKVQELLTICGEHIEAEENATSKSTHQSAAVLGIAMISMAEPLGAASTGRLLEHLLTYCDPAVRRTVPLAFALLRISDPDVQVMDTLSRLSHDADTDVAANAIVALGFVGAGTNNARLAGLLRNLSSYYYKDQQLLFLVRVAQGLVHMGKGLLTLCPYHTDRQLLSGVGLAGIMGVLFACMDNKALICGKHHYLLYTLATAMKPRMLMTLDESGKSIAVPVRVGQALDTVAQAGRPKTITGFQTHSTPVLLAAGERAELATEKYIPLSPILEGLVVLKENPNYHETE